MEPTVIEAGTVVIRGMRQGEVRALARQKNADNIKNIVSSENIGRFPDPNAAEAVQHMPGVTDQGHQSNVFYVLDRDSFSLLGSFTGSHTVNTDGIALSNSPFGSFSSGAFFAVHDDGGVSAFSWQTIADSLGLALPH